MTGSATEQPAGREAGIADDQAQILVARKPNTIFPGLNGGDGKAQVGGHLFQGDAVAFAPEFQHPGKIRAQIESAGRQSVHGPIVTEANNSGKARRNPPKKRCRQSPVARRKIIADCPGRLGYSYDQSR